MFLTHHIGAPEMSLMNFDSLTQINSQIIFESIHFKMNKSMQHFMAYMVTKEGTIIKYDTRIFNNTEFGTTGMA